MKKLLTVSLLVVALTAWSQNTEIHDPWLNWDFYNLTPLIVDDLHIVVDTPDWTPPEVYTGTFPAFESVTVGGVDTELRWSGTAIGPGEVAHVGAFMEGSGPILGAYWTAGGTPQYWYEYDQGVGPLTLPITYERTFVEFPVADDPEVWMQLSMPEAVYDDLTSYYPDAVVSWGGIRGFRDVPAATLGLDDLNDALDLGVLAAGGYEVDLYDRNGGTLIGSGLYEVPPDSFFDVTFGVPEYTGPQYESLLYAQVWVDLDGEGEDEAFPVGQFWNLNSQSPEPGTLLYMGVALAGFMLRRRRRG